MVEQLLKAGAVVDKAETGYGATPLVVAAHQGHEGVVEQLLKAGADADYSEMTSGAFRFTPLMAAAFKGHSRICSLLLEAGANVDYAVVAEGTALRFAVAHGHREAAVVLMEHGASCGDGVLAQPMLEDLFKWMAEALKESSRTVAEKNREKEQMAQGISAWCAEAASSSAE